MINADSGNEPATDQAQKVRNALEEATSSALLDDPGYTSRPLSVLNKEATELQKAGKHIQAVAAYNKLFAKVKQRNLIHAELYTCHSNRAAAYLQLGLFEEALQDAEKGRALATARLKVTRKSIPGYVKTYLRKGAALNGLKRYREACLVLEEGLKIDPFNAALKAALDEASQGVLGDILAGRGLERRALPPPEPTQRISSHAYSAPLHKIRTDDLLPTKLLTPFQAESDHHVKDTYNYVTIQTDIKMPARQIRMLQDRHRCRPFQDAVRIAVAKIKAEDKDVRMLHLGCGAGLLALTAFSAGAYHVTAVDRWLYLSLICKETLVKNWADDAKYDIIYKRPTDLRLKSDVKICCNLLVCEMFDEGLLTSGLIPSIRHAIQELMADEMVVLPAAATVFVQAAEIRISDICGVDLSPSNQYRWHPSHLAGVPLEEGMYKPLSHPVEAWHFDLKAPVEASENKALDLTFHTDGRMNAVIFWYTLELIEDITFSTGLEAVKAGLKSLGPAVQYLAGEMPVEAGAVIPLQASHNTVAMRFDVREADYIHLAKPDASFPAQHFSSLRDKIKLQAYKEATQRAIAQRKASRRGAHVLDMGSGSGFFSAVAGKEGADSVLACDVHQPMAHLTQRVLAVNHLSGNVSVVHSDAALLERGREVRPLGVNIVLADIFDAGFIGNNFLYLLDICKRKIIQPDCTFIPASATLYCMGVEVLTPKTGGFDFSALDKFRWDKGYEACCLEDIPHKRLTNPAKALRFGFETNAMPYSRDNIIRLDVIESGQLNAIAFWFDLELDEQCTITTAPGPIGVGGQSKPENDATEATESSSNTCGEKRETDVPVNELCKVTLTVNGIGDDASVSVNIALVSQELPITAGRAKSYGQALQYTDNIVEVKAGSKLAVIVKRDASEVRFKTRAGVGAVAERAPWKIEWGGGSSVENPHYQRVHYCQLLVTDFLQRVKSQRFPSIEKDMKMVLSHCGSLLLDSAALCQVYHELLVMEKLQAQAALSPAAALEAVTRMPLRNA